ncbi:MAG: prepilin-type N-terminal cleavage/methylation domain-containing protein [Ruminococcaceae bacterium]|nr:prepilin-type N-terminal cleavage/methylation domain-containing protein [Oscillospiraceae bacterium]
MIKKIQALRAKKGFTLVELIVVIAIIGVLAAILIPTLSGVIESARKRSAESTCQSIQNLAKTFASTVMSKTGNLCDASSQVDMDDGKGPQTMQQYIETQIPEISGSSDKGAAIVLTAGNVTSVTYTEGAFTALWDSTNGMQGATKTGDSGAHTPAGAGSVAVS